MLSAVAITLGYTITSGAPSLPLEARRFTMSATATTSSIRPDLAAAMGDEPTAGMADEESLLAASTFPIPPDELISLAKAFTAAQHAGTADGSNGGADWFAEDFRFVAPVVGPFDKSEFIDSLKSFDLKTAFGALSSNYHHWRVCPFEPDRVWYSVKYIGVNDGPVLGKPATGKSVESPVQAHSITFNEKGEVKKFTIGYVLDKETGNTGGLGGELSFSLLNPGWPCLTLWGRLSLCKRLYGD